MVAGLVAVQPDIDLEDLQRGARLRRREEACFRGSFRGPVLMVEEKLPETWDAQGVQGAPALGPLGARGVL